MTEREKAFEKAKKVYELFKQGVDGERESAQIAFERICKKYDFAENDFDDEAICEFVVRYKNQMEMELIIQIAAMIQDKNGCFRYRPNHKEVIMNLPRKDYIRAMIHVDMLLPHFRSEFERGIERYRERIKFWSSDDAIDCHAAAHCRLRLRGVKAEIAKYRRNFAYAFIIAHNIFPSQNAAYEEDDENELGQKLIGESGHKRGGARSSAFDAYFLAGSIKKMEVRDRVTNGELPA